MTQNPKIEMMAIDGHLTFFVDGQAFARLTSLTFDTIGERYADQELLETVVRLFFGDVAVAERCFGSHSECRFKYEIVLNRSHEPRSIPLAFRTQEPCGGCTPRIVGDQRNPDDTYSYRVECANDPTQYVTLRQTLVLQDAPFDREMNKASESMSQATAAIQPKEAVNHPAHYNQGNIEVIDAIEDWCLGFHEGNVVKYVARHRHKNGIEDLKKARWYLDRLIEQMEPKEGGNL